MELAFVWAGLGMGFKINDMNFYVLGVVALKKLMHFIRMW